MKLYSYICIFFFFLMRRRPPRSTRTTLSLHDALPSSYLDRLDVGDPESGAEVGEDHHQYGGHCAEQDAEGTAERPETEDLGVNQRDHRISSDCVVSARKVSSRLGVPSVKIGRAHV